MPDSRPLFPSFEECYLYIPKTRMPYKYALVGITFPNPRYNVHRMLPQNPNAENINLFEYVLEGEGEIFIGGEWHPVRAGDVFILRSSQTQIYRSNKKNPWKKIWFNYYANYIDSYLDSCGIESGVYSDTNAKNHFETALRIAKEQSMSSDDYYAILDCMHKIIQSVSITSIKECSSIEFSIREELDDSIYEKVDLDKIAEKLHLSKSNLIRIFKKRYHITPYDYLINAKIETAKMLLLSTQLTSKEIAKKLCFSNEHYFSTLFLHRAGVRPRAFRTQMYNESKDRYQHLKGIP